MPTLRCYVDDRTLAILTEYGARTGRKVEELAEAAIAEAAIRALPPAPRGGVDPVDLASAKQIYLAQDPMPDGERGASTSYLQRKMQWGYNHSVAVIEALQAEGWVSAPDHRGRRFVVGT